MQLAVITNHEDNTIQSVVICSDPDKFKVKIQDKLGFYLSDSDFNSLLRNSEITVKDNGTYTNTPYFNIKIDQD